MRQIPFRLTRSLPLAVATLVASTSFARAQAAPHGQAYALLASAATPSAAIPAATVRGSSEASTPPLTVALSDLPDAPGWVLPVPAPPIPPCPARDATRAPAGAIIEEPRSTLRCIEVNPFRRFLDATTPIPLTPRQKGYLAIHNLRDPGNLITIAGTAAFTVGLDSHTAYGPGWRGVARNAGYSFSQDATGEFFGTFLIPSLLHEDPHYHREPGASIPRRIVHAISRTVIAQHDDGSMMPNYAVLLTYPISAELSNLYVPGVHGDAASTAKRIVTGLSTDPIGNLITEFLPDVAKRVNIRVIFVQRVLNMVAAESIGGPGALTP